MHDSYGDDYSIVRIARADTLLQGARVADVLRNLMLLSKTWGFRGTKEYVF